MSIIQVKRTFEPPHDKTNKVTVRPAKTQISLGTKKKNIKILIFEHVQTIQIELQCYRLCHI